MNQESTLFAGARKMAGESPTAVFELYAPALYKYAFRLCNHAGMADQVVGDVFAKFVEQLSAGRHPGLNLRLYLYGIAYGILVRDSRYAPSLVRLETAVVRYADRSATDLDPQDRGFSETLQQALLHDLTSDQRHVVILRFVEGFSLKETAWITGKTVGNVKVIQNRGIAALRKALDYQEAETHAIALFIRRMAHA